MDVSQEAMDAALARAYKLAASFSSDMKGAWVGFMATKVAAKVNNEDFLPQLGMVHLGVGDDDAAFKAGLETLGFPRVTGSPTSGASSSFELHMANYEHYKKFVVTETDQGRPKYACGTILTPTCVATYRHGSHSRWKIDDVKTYTSMLDNAAPFSATVAHICDESDFILLSVDESCNLPRAQLYPLPYIGMPYVMLGFSSRTIDHPIAYMEGKIINGDVDKGSLIYGSSECRKGDSGGAVFNANGNGLVAMVVGWVSASGEYLQQDLTGQFLPSGVSNRCAMIRVTDMMKALPLKET